MKSHKLFLILLISFQQLVFSADKMVFEPKSTDFALSPYTGMTRESWKEAASYLLTGAFSYIKTLDDPMKFPKQEGISYPQKESQIPTEKLEGLSRTLFVAAPLLRDNPDLVVNNLRVADYYRYQFKKLIDPASDSYIKPRLKNQGASQNLVEFGAIAISLTFIPEVLWEPLSKTDKDALAALMLSYADGPTVDSNWKFFNIFVLSFFKEQGYQVNDTLLNEYLQRSLKHYRGEGWYNDSPAYDYYSMWAFQMYGVIWSHYYGKNIAPEIAAQFLKNFDDLADFYPFMFDANGKMIMYGRSISYRYSSVTPLLLMGLQEKEVNWGWMRRIASSTLLQFLKHPDFMKDSVPTLGFYGPFEPAVQMYSCRGSVYWSGKAFLGLFIPENSPFWTSKENNGAWNNFKKDSVYQHFSPSTGILVTNYPEIGASELRSWCFARKKDDWQKFRSTENYNRLSYSSAFPWQADGKNGEVAMNYVFSDNKTDWEPLRLYRFQKFENDIYYRQAMLESDTCLKIHLAEFSLPNGILRVDKISYTGTQNISKEVHLGHYALPEFEKPVIERRIKLGSGLGKGLRIDNGEYSIVMTPYYGWKNIETISTENLHPQTKKSYVINSSTIYSNVENEKLIITFQGWKKSGSKWNKTELNPVKKIKISEDKKLITIILQNKTEKQIRF